MNKKLILAPMAGVTDNVFRDICYRFGAFLTFTEMVSAKGLFYSSDETASLLAPSGNHPEGAQIFGSDPEIIASQIKKPIFDCFDVIDINMGCPAKKIISNGEGSALMKNIPLACSIAAEAVKATNKPVTVKIRAGFIDKNCVSFAKEIEKTGIAAITIHGRTCAQAYRGKADLDAIKEVKEAVKIPVIANGDVIDGASAKKMLEYTNCDAVMIGRGAQGRPWIFSEIDAFLNGKEFTLTNKQKLDIAAEHGVRLARERGEYTAMLQMRKHLSWYTHGFFSAAQIRNKINSVNDIDSFLELIEQIKSYY